MSRSFFKNLLALAAALLIAGILYYFHAVKPRGPKTYAARRCQFIESGGARQKLLLPDGSVMLIFPNTSVKISCGFGATDRRVIFAGEAYFRIAPGPALPFTVISKNLSVTATAGSFHFLANPKEAGEQLELLRGSLTAAKTYASPDSGRETLAPGQMVMINRSVDLMEKENFDTTSLASTVKRLLR